MTVIISSTMLIASIQAPTYAEFSNTYNVASNAIIAKANYGALY